MDQEQQRGVNKVRAGIISRGPRKAKAIAQPKEGPKPRVSMSAKSLGPFNPNADLRNTLVRRADQNDNPGPAQIFPPAPEYEPTQIDRASKRRARRLLIAGRF